MKRLFIINHYLLMSFRTHDLRNFANTQLMCSSFLCFKCQCI